jgi:hypothetical protein
MPSHDRAQRWRDAATHLMDHWASAGERASDLRGISEGTAPGISQPASPRDEGDRDTVGFRLRGGRLTMRGRILPERQSSSRDAISSMCDAGKERVCGLGSQKARWIKATKSRRTSAAYSWVRQAPRSPSPRHTAEATRMARRQSSQRFALILPEEIRRRAEAWLASEMTPWRAQFQPKVTRPPEFPLK